MVHLEKGKKYLWCQCGKSKDQPFCDGTHHGSKFKPILFEARRDGPVKLCNCKATKKGPFCDNSHVKLAEEVGEKEMDKNLIRE
ncbi:MAG: CDGSH iron-sulfur domain-containing protein [Bacteroidota bacterium]